MMICIDDVAVVVVEEEGGRYYTTTTRYDDDVDGFLCLCVVFITRGRCCIKTKVNEMEKGRSDVNDVNAHRHTSSGLHNYYKKYPSFIHQEYCASVR